MLTIRREPRDVPRVAAALATVETVAALAIAHTAAGGTPPSLALLLIFAVLVYGAGLVVLCRRLPIRYVVPGLILAQVLLHGWLNALAPAEHAAHAAMDSAAAPFGLTWTMLLAHTVAGASAALSWWLRRRSVAVLVRWSQPVAVGPQVRHRARTRGPERPVAELLQVALAPTRGPPGAALLPS
ncbi:hypothetical protein FXB39_06725 [Nocardioides sp. BGMRC 2183]|nr:hypothetical protein FXB39_06725 [Nocardioides sp. BGMRC 2183]